MVRHEQEQQQMEWEYDDLARVICELIERHKRSTLPIERQFLGQDFGIQRARLKDLQQRLRREYPGSTRGFFPLPDRALPTLEGV